MLVESLPVILITAALYGATMKFADLFDEHGMQWFKGDKLFFGFLWGACGIILVLSRADIANLIFAMVLAFIVRMRIDYRNHAIASAMIIVTFACLSQFEGNIFWIFFLTFAVFGGIRDYLGNVRKKHDWIYMINEPAWYNVLPPFIYAVATGNWVLFWVGAIFIIFYDAVKYGFFYLHRYPNL